MVDMTAVDWEARMSARAEVRRRAGRDAEEVVREAEEATARIAREERRSGLVAQRVERGGAALCPHGYVVGDNSASEGLVFACGRATCDCCERIYSFIGSAMYSFGPDGEHGHTSTPDTALCYECGGQDEVKKW